MASISACHAEDPGSIPGLGVLPTLAAILPWSTSAHLYYLGVTSLLCQVETAGCFHVALTNRHSLDRCGPTGIHLETSFRHLVE